MEPIRHILSLEPGTYLIKIHDNRKAAVLPLMDCEVKEILMAVGESE